MKRTIVLLTPVLVGVSASVVTAILLLSYARTLAYNGVDFVTRGKTTVRVRLLLFPLPVGLVLTLISGLALVMLLPTTDGPHSALAYWFLFPWYFVWYQVPGPTCNQFSPLASASRSFTRTFSYWTQWPLRASFFYYPTSRFSYTTRFRGPEGSYGLSSLQSPGPSASQDP